MANGASSMMIAALISLVLLLLAAKVPSSSAFHLQTVQSGAAAHRLTRPTASVALVAPTIPSRSTTLAAEQNEGSDGDAAAEKSEAEHHLAANHKTLHKLITTVCPSLYATLASSEQSYTIFAPNEAAFEDLGDKKLQQLFDPRNLETAEKICNYHVVLGEAVNAERLRREDWTVPKKDGKPQLSVGGIKTVGGELAVGRSKSGGFLGWGAKEDGGVVMGGDANARIVKSTKVDDGRGIVHEVDALANPLLLWRFMDQLRIPGF